VTARPGPGQPQARVYETPRSAARLRRLSRWQTEGMREDLADLYVESTVTASGQEYRGREDFLNRLAGDVRQPGFGMLVAETKAPVGCVFGFPVGRDGSWWQGFQGLLPQPVEQLTAAGHVFAITTILVHPRERNRGLTGRLLERLFADHNDAALGATLLDHADDTAHDALASLGWQQIGEVHRSSGPRVLRALVISGTRQAARIATRVQ
jgi:GNAT superfamily N-acetyltransferase